MMRKNLVLILVVTMVFSIFAFGCQGTAKRPLNPNQPNNVAPDRTDMTTPGTDQTTLTDSEARSLAKKLADEAQKVKGVRRASVVVSDNTANLGNPNSNRNNVGNVAPNGNTSMDTGIRDSVGTPNNGVVGPNNGMVGTPNNLGNNSVGNNNLGNNNLNGLVVMVGLELDNMNNAGNMDNIQREVASRLKAADKRVNQVYITTDASLMERIDNVADNITNGRTMSALTNDVEDIFRSLTAQGPAF